MQKPIRKIPKKDRATQECDPSVLGALQTETGSRPFICLRGLGSGCLVNLLNVKPLQRSIRTVCKAKSVKLMF